MAEGVIVADAGGNLVFVNAAASRMHGVETLGVGVEGYADTFHLLTEDGKPYPSSELPLARAVMRGETVIDERWRIRAQAVFRLRLLEDPATVPASKSSPDR